MTLFLQSDRFGVRRLVTALGGTIHWSAIRLCSPAMSPEGEMNFAFEGGDESPRSMSEGLASFSKMLLR